MGKALGLYYFYVVGAMIYTQVVFFRARGCHLQAPVTYLWLVFQIAAFYLLVAYAIALWGAYICWQADKDQQVIDKAILKYMKQKMHEEHKL